jgi:hypothetical protein
MRNSRPLSASQKILRCNSYKKELYVNARAVHSMCDGGANGHLSITIMPVADYLTLMDTACEQSVHHGVAPPVHPANSTSSQITEANRQFRQDVDDHQLFLSVHSVCEALKQQIHLTVNKLVYVQVLEDIDIRFSDVMPTTMPAHLKAICGTITPEDVEANRSILGSDWNPDEPIEDLWLRIKEWQRFAAAATEPIPDATVICLVLAILEKPGVITAGTDKWHGAQGASHPNLGQP